MAGFVGSYNDEGNSTDEGATATALDSAFEIDSTQINAKIFPLRMTVTGKVKGKVQKPTTWEFPFDAKSWSYKEPAKWPMRGMEF